MKKNVTLIRLMVSYLFLVNIAYATVWYVHPDSIMNCIQDGLDSCSTGDTVLVGPGTYYENIIWPNTQGIDLISEYGPDSTILDGDSTGSVLTVANGMDTNTIIIDFTIRNGLAQIGGGILCSNHSAPKICGNIITSNIATSTGYDGGAGIACIDSSAPFISGNTMHSNTAYSSGSGIMCNYYSSPIIKDNIIAGNVAFYGGGIFCNYHSSPIITGNTISYNQCLPVKNINMLVDYSRKVTNSIDFKRPPPSGGGIFLLGECAPLIDGNSIIGNSAMWGGGIFCVSSSPTICSTTISENIAVYYGGGGIYISGSSLLFINNIVTANVAAFGGGICCEYASIIIDSCTISNNNRDGIYCNHVAPVINYNNITNNIGYGVRNDWSGIIVNAEYNWWGDASGPYHATANPGGLGDTVSDYVDFIPWDTVPYPWGIEEYESAKPMSVFLQISPNPFSRLTKISFGNVNEAKNVELKVYDATGRLVKEFNHLTNQQILWNGTDNSNRKLPSGVYFLKMEAGDYSGTEKLLLIR